LDEELPLRKSNFPNETVEILDVLRAAFLSKSVAQGADAQRYATGAMFSIGHFSKLESENQN
jgi:hypothetical protein